MRMTLGQKITAYLESLGKDAAKTFKVSPQKVAAWKRKPETAPFAVYETANEWYEDALTVPEEPMSTTATEIGESHPALSRHDWGEPEPAAPMATEAQSIVDHVYALEDRIANTENGINQILSLLQGGQQPLRQSPTATTHRISPVPDANGNLPAFVSVGPDQLATHNLTRPSRDFLSGQAQSEADLDRLDPTRHKPAVDPANARALWMRPKILPARR